MKTLKITTDNKISIIDVDFSDYRALKRAVGGYVETVHTRNLYAYFKAPVMNKMLNDFPVLVAEEK